MKYGYKEGEKSSNNSSIQIREEEEKKTFHLQSKKINNK